MRSADIAANCRETALRVEISGEWGELADTLRDAADEVERLRLTEEERESLRGAVALYAANKMTNSAALLHALASRQGGGA